MGLFDIFKGKKTTSATQTSTTSNTAQTATTQQSVATPVVANTNVTQGLVIDMSKHQENLNKVVINMSKNSKIDMSKHTAKVAVAMDYSGSMDWLYRNGSVQKTITRLLPIALRFDDNGELESWLFSNSYKRLSAANKDNYSDYVKNVMQHSGMYMGGTSYAPVLSDIVSNYKDSQNIPAFVIFITDGENNDVNSTDKIVRELSKYNMFIQFVGIGNEPFTYLEKLDSLSGRVHDNTGFIKVKDMDKMDDEQLYTALLSQYKTWLNNK